MVAADSITLWEFNEAWEEVQRSMHNGSFDVRKLVPKPKNIGSTDKDDTNARLFSAKVKMMLMLSKFPEKVFNLVSHGETACLGPSIGVAADDGEFAPGAYLCCKIDKGFRSAFLVKHYAEQGFTAQAVEQIDRKDPRAIMELLDLFACIGPNTRLHPACQQKACCAQFLERRGRLTKDKVSALIKDDFGIDFVNNGCYKNRVEGDVTVVQHVDGARVNWPNRNLRPEGAAMVDNHNDHMAAIVIDSLTPIKLKTFFAKNIGPNAPMVMNKKCAATNQLAIEAEQQLRVAAEEKERDAERQKVLDRALGDNRIERVRAAVAKRRPSEPPAKKHRAMLGDLLQRPPAAAPVPLMPASED